MTGDTGSNDDFRLDAAVERLVAQLEGGQDAIVAGKSAGVTTILAAATLRLEDGFEVVSVPAQDGGLTLSRLIAHLSGREKLDEHDDAALSLGIRRLTAPQAPNRPVVLLVNGGLHRSALRFLRQVTRSAPTLRLVLTSCDGMHGLLGETGMEELRARLEACAPVMLTGEIAAPQALVEAPTLAPAERPMLLTTIAAPKKAVRMTVDVQSNRPRFRGLWTASALGMAASLALGAWLGGQDLRPPSPVVVTGASQWLTTAAIPIVAAQTSLPEIAASVPGNLIGTALPSPERSASPTVATRSPMPRPVAPPMPSPTTSARMDVVLDAPPTPLIASALPEPVVVPSGPTVASNAQESQFVPMQDVLPHPAAVSLVPRDLHIASQSATRLPRQTVEDRHRPARVAQPSIMAENRAAYSRDRLRQLPSDWQRDQAMATNAYRERSEELRSMNVTPPPPVRYHRSAPFPDGDSPEWRGERAVAPLSGPFIGTYVAGPFGSRVFRYEP